VERWHLFVLSKGVRMEAKMEGRSWRRKLAAFLRDPPRKAHSPDAAAQAEPGVFSFPR